MNRAADASVRLFGAVVRPFQAFLRLEAASAILLVACAVAALVWANVHPATYTGVFGYELAVGAGGSLTTFTVRDVVNDGLMAIFFFVVGMEVKRELAIGELSTTSKAILPAIAALGGMIAPACIFTALNLGGPGQAGWAIPMATDIAFSLGVLTLLGSRVSRGLIVFLTALAIFDDIGGIIVIAIFYGHGLDVPWLLGAAAIAIAVFGLGRMYVTNGFAYALGGAALWYALHHGGIHATIAGVVLGLAIPARPRRPSREVLEELANHVRELNAKPEDEAVRGQDVLMIEEKLEDLQAPLNRFIHTLHPFVAFFVMPVFALANAGVDLRNTGIAGMATPVAIGIAAGLLVGKAVGIFTFTLAATRLGKIQMPGGATTAHVIGVSFVAGIGFTVALFMASLAYATAPALLDQAKIGIVVGSVVSGLVGYSIVRLTRPARDVSA
jgi:NhaA family Na+:H+ antiporter